MNYIALLNRYWTLREQGILDRNAGDLYLYLLYKSNSLGWKNPFNQSNALICGFLGINEKTLIANRNKLKQVGVISFASGHKGKNTEYIIFPVSMGGQNYSETGNTGQNYTQNDSLNDSLTGSLNDSLSGEKSTDNTKQVNKTKQNNECDNARAPEKPDEVETGTGPPPPGSARPPAPDLPVGFRPGLEYLGLELPEMKIGIQVQRIKHTRKVDVTSEQVLGLWAVFKQEYFTGKKTYQNDEDIFRHFGNWIKDQRFAASNTGTEKTGTGINSKIGGFEILASRLRDQLNNPGTTDY